MAPSTVPSTSGLAPLSRSRPNPAGTSTTIWVLRAAQAAIGLGCGSNRRLHREIPGAGKTVEQVPALRRVVMIERRHLQVFDVEGNAVSEGQHQNDGPKDGKNQPNWVAQQFNGFAA